MLIKKSRNFFFSLMDSNSRLSRVFDKLIVGAILTHGHNNAGKITIRSRGGAHKRAFRVIDFMRYIWNVRNIVLSIEHNPIRQALYNLVSYSNGVLANNLSVEGVPISVTTMNTNLLLEQITTVGYAAQLKYMKSGSIINSLELKLLKGAQYIRAPGMYSKLVSVTPTHSIVKLRSKFLLKVNNLCIAVFGVLKKNNINSTISQKKAGYSRHVGRRPHVRGVAMNPVDHPHGGGEGKTSGGRPSVTPWSLITKGRKTRRKLRYGTFILKR